ncbi:MAG: hypothetical protein ACP5QT_05730 [Brevinematia bacterium]
MEKIIPFNKPCHTGNEKKYVLKVMKSDNICGDSNFTKKCQQWFENDPPYKKALLNLSCTHTLEMCAILIDIKLL